VLSRISGLSSHEYSLNHSTKAGKIAVNPLPATVGGTDAWSDILQAKIFEKLNYYSK
jgi:hypothetical protein